MRSRQRTLRGRVSAVGLLVVAAWLLLLTVAVNVILAQRLARDVDSRLRTRAIAVAATVQLAPHGRLRVNEPAADDVLDSGIWIFGHGQTVEAPPGQDTVARAARRIANGPGGFATADGNIRLYAQPVTRSRRRVATVVTALSTTASHRSRDEALVGSIALALLAMAGAYAALRWTAARALQPVARMTHHAAELSATRMAERFDTHQRFAELDELATTFNDALDRQAAAVRHERQLLADLSHELRTPLTRIVAETDLLLARSHATAATDTAHRNIRASAMTMNRIIETLLSTSRVDNLAATGSCRLDVAVNAVLQQRATYTAGHSSLAWALDVPCLAVGAEAAVVERILAPILDNAERYAATTIRITADRNEHSVVIDVDDDGPGVDAQVAEEIFTPGRQFGYPAPAGGAGLGLPLARRLARATGGDVTHPGGSTFRILLPPA